VLLKHASDSGPALAHGRIDDLRSWCEVVFGGEERPVELSGLPQELHKLHGAITKRVSVSRAFARETNLMRLPRIS
jgi:hypothetical protein